MLHVTWSADRVQKVNSSGLRSLNVFIYLFFFRAEFMETIENKICKLPAMVKTIDHTFTSFESKTHIKFKKLESSIVLFYS